MMIMPVQRNELGSSVLLFLFVLHFVRSSSPISPNYYDSLQEGQNHVESVGLKPCSKKYIILTTQRSGSTWTCNELDSQDDVACGASRDDKTQTEVKVSELLLKHHGGQYENPSTVKWEEYEKELDASFADVCADDHKSIIGYKIMYNQIPEKFTLAAGPDGSPFARYLQKNEISVIHLVREAGILRISSLRDLILQDIVHESDESKIEELRDVDKMPWNETTIKELVSFDTKISKYHAFFSFVIGVKYFRLTYENMVIDLETQLAQILGFLHHPTVRWIPEVRKSGTLKQLHETTCSERINDYDKFIQDTRVPLMTRSACKMLQTFADNQN